MSFAGETLKADIKPSNATKVILSSNAPVAEDTLTAAVTPANVTDPFVTAHWNGGLNIHHIHIQHFCTQSYQ